MSELDKVGIEKAKEMYIDLLYKGYTIAGAREKIGVKEGVVWEWGQKDKEFKHNIFKAIESQLLAKDPIPTRETGDFGEGIGYIRPSERNFE